MAGKIYNDAETEARRLGISVRTLDRRCRDDGFPYIRLGRARLFDPDLTDQFLADRAVAGRAAEMAATPRRARRLADARSAATA